MSRGYVVGGGGSGVAELRRNLSLGGGSPEGCSSGWALQGGGCRAALQAPSPKGSRSRGSGAFPHPLDWTQGGGLPVIASGSPHKCLST